MTKTEFLQILREELDGRVPYSVIQENLNYYNSYIDGETAKGLWMIRGSYSRLTTGGPMASTASSTVSYPPPFLPAATAPNMALPIQLPFAMAGTLISLPRTSAMICIMRGFFWATPPVA